MLSVDDRACRPFDVVCFGYNPWSPMWKRNQTMVSLLAELRCINSVLFLNPDVYGGNFLRRPLAQLRTPFRFSWSAIMKRRITTKVSVFTPLHMPFYSKVKSLGNLTNHICRKTVSQYVRKPYLLILNRLVSFESDYFAEIYRHAAVRHFDWSDDFETFCHTRESRRTSAVVREQYLSECNLVTTVNDHLAHRAKSISRHVLTVPNATDFALMSRSNSPDTPCHRRISRLSGPVIGYMGYLNSERLDLKLIDFISERRPEWNLVFVGPKSVPEPLGKELPKRKNVHTIPPVRYQHLPSILKRFDVCIIPNRINDHTRGNNPIKLYDYLATGRPIVSTRTAGTEGFSSLIHLADSPEDFLFGVESALASGRDQAAKEARLRAARSNSWPIRFAPVFDKLVEMMTDYDG